MISGDYCKQFSYTSTTKGCFPSRFWDDIIEIEFENEKVKVFRNYDMYLRENFGDYMKFPPKEQQVTQHNFKAYRR